MSPQVDLSGPVPGTLIPELQFCNNAMSISSISDKKGRFIPSETMVNSFAPDQEHYFFDLGEEKLVLPTEVTTPSTQHIRKRAKKRAF